MPLTTTNRRPSLSGGDPRKLTGQAKDAYFKEIGRRAGAKRMILSGAEKEALVLAYRFLGRIAERHGISLHEDI